MNFFEIINPNIEKLTKNEYEILDYVIKHMNEIHNQNIREVAAACFVSTTTFLRFVRKIGFSGYSEFTTVIKYTVLNNQEKPAATATFDMKQSDYREEYLKNIEETVRVLDDNKLNSLCELMMNRPKIFIFAKGFSKYAAEYVEYLYTLEGFLVVFPKNFEQRKLAYRNIGKDDLVFVMSYSGDDQELIRIIQVIKNQCDFASLVSVTGANNNSIQNLSDYNLYVFSDEIHDKKIEITSHVSMIVIMELLLYQFREYKGGQENI